MVYHCYHHLVMGKMMGKKPLTVTTAKALKEPGMHLDGSVPGLYLRIAPGGSKSFILRTVVKGKRRDIGLGGFPTTSLAEARDEARLLRFQARKGGDPLAERRKAHAPTFKIAAALVHREQIIPPTKNGKHQDQWINTLKQYVFPIMGDQTVDDISSADVLRALSTCKAPLLCTIF